MTESSLLDVDRGPGFLKMFHKKNPSNLIQKLFMTETVSTVIVKSYLL